MHAHPSCSRFTWHEDRGSIPGWHSVPLQSRRAALTFPRQAVEGCTSSPFRQYRESSFPGICCHKMAACLLHSRLLGRQHHLPAYPTWTLAGKMLGDYHCKGQHQYHLQAYRGKEQLRADIPFASQGSKCRAPPWALAAVSAFLPSQTLSLLCCVARVGLVPT